ncbi:MAG: hypothetical protein LBF22_00505 [Deltaproteobacteria bacterium]|jgi:hypothetical protein|nr:hypothetical protein [Deltaproteobacteria bacterium]
MLKYLTILITLSVLFFSTNVACANDIPEYDIRDYCEKKSKKVGGDYKFVSTCRNSEEAARSHLKKMEYKENMLTGCLSSVGKRSGDIGISYIDLENCVVKKLYDSIN